MAGMAGSQWALKTENEEYISGLERKLAKAKATSSQDAAALRSPTRGFLLPRALVNGTGSHFESFDDGASSPSGSTDGGSTIVPNDDEDVYDRVDTSEEVDGDPSLEGEALLLDPADQAGLAEALEAGGSPIDFSRGAIVRPGLQRQGAAEAFSVSPRRHAAPSSSSWSAQDATPRPPLLPLANTQETFSPDSDSASDDEDGDEDDGENGLEVVMAATDVDNKRHSIKFHDTVRIHGGIKRSKRRRRRPPNAGAPPARGRQASNQYSPRDPSPLREQQLFTELKPAAPAPSRSGYFEPSLPATPTAPTFGAAAGARTPPVVLSPHPRVPSHPATLSSSPASHFHFHFMPGGGNRSRRPSSTTSFRAGTDGYGSGFASVLTSATQSRSSSPASSIYAPLRVPAVRAPAPFFGPTPERLSKMREKKEAARREAERSKGGWRTWWFGSPSSSSSKGKSKAAAAEANEVEDEENAPCYHDVILEHERSRRERRMMRMRSASFASSSLAPHPELEQPAEDTPPPGLWAWLFGRPENAAPPPPAEVHNHAHPHPHPHPHPHSHRSHGTFPIHGPLPSPAPGHMPLPVPPGRGRPLHKSRSGLLSGAATPLPDVSEDEVMSSTSTPAAMSPSLHAAAVVNDTLLPPPTESTALLTPDRSPSGTPAPSFFSHPVQWLARQQRRRKRRRRLKPKTEVYVRFGPAPRRWVKAAWWRWRWRLLRRWVVEKWEGLKEGWDQWWDNEESWDEERWQQV